MSAVAKAMPKLVTKPMIAEFMGQFDAFIFDCDGVLWTGDTIIDRANLFINHLKTLGKEVFLMTNNSTKSTESFKAKCDTLKFDVDQEKILGSSVVLARYLKSINFDQKAYVVGSSGIKQELDKVGIANFGVGPDPMLHEDMQAFYKSLCQGPGEFEEGVGAVVVGFDCHLSLPKLLKASSYIHRNPACLFLATNTDENFPTPDNLILFPGTGSMVRAVETVVGKAPMVMGKPHTRAFDVIRAQCEGLEPKRALMVGDRLNTDILFGHNCGTSTMLVLSGVHKLQDAEERCTDPARQGEVPDYYVQSLGALLDMLEI